MLKSGDHPFIEHESVIAIRNDTAKQREPISRELLTRVQAGLLDSDFTPNGVRQYFREVMENSRE